MWREGFRPGKLGRYQEAKHFPWSFDSAIRTQTRGLSHAIPVTSFNRRNLGPIGRVKGERKNDLKKSRVLELLKAVNRLWQEDLSVLGRR